MESSIGVRSISTACSVQPRSKKKPTLVPSLFFWGYAKASASSRSALKCDGGSDLEKCLMILIAITWFESRRLAMFISLLRKSHALQQVLTYSLSWASDISWTNDFALSNQNHLSNFPGYSAINHASYNLA